MFKAHAQRNRGQRRAQLHRVQRIVGKDLCSAVATDQDHRQPQPGGTQQPHHFMAALDPAQREAVAAAVVAAIRPIFWIVTGLGLIGFVLALRLEEILLANRIVGHKAPGTH